MCDLNAYIQKTGPEDISLYLENVDIIRPEGEAQVYLKSMFGEERRFAGRIKEIQAIRRRIILEEA